MDGLGSTDLDPGQRVVFAECRGGAASPSSVPWLVPAESSCPQRPLQTVFLCASVNESRLGCSVSEWRGGEFSREDCAGQRVVSIIQGKHWAAWLHALDVTKAGRTEMDETMRLPLPACLPGCVCHQHFHIFSSSCLPPRPQFCNSCEGLTEDSQHWINLWIALLVSAV